MEAALGANVTIRCPVKGKSGVSGVRVGDRVVPGVARRWQLSDLSPTGLTVSEFPAL